MTVSAHSCIHSLRLRNAAIRRTPGFKSDFIHLGTGVKKTLSAIFLAFHKPAPSVDRLSVACYESFLPVVKVFFLFANNFSEF